MIAQQFGVCAIVTFGFGAFAMHGLDCAFGGGCGDLEPVESGEFIITQLSHGNHDPSDQWLLEVLPGARQIGAKA